MIQTEVEKHGLMHGLECGLVRDVIWFADEATEMKIGGFVDE